METEAKNPTQLDLFPEIGFEGHWLDWPYEWSIMDNRFLAFCREFDSRTTARRPFVVPSKVTIPRRAMTPSESTQYLGLEDERRSASPKGWWGPWPRSLIGEAAWNSLLLGFRS